MPKTKTRTATEIRKSTETTITCKLNVDGKGVTKIKTPIGILTHMLELFAFHGFFDLNLEVKGDTHIDIHHTNEDIGIVLGKVFKKALGEKKAGIKRFGSAFAPMESTLGHTVVDISGRGYFSMNLEATYPFKIKQGAHIEHIGDEQELRTVLGDILQDQYALKYLEHFLESFAHNLGATIKVKLSYPTADLHTNLETVFKSLGIALDQATTIDPRRGKAVPSTKGIID